MLSFLSEILASAIHQPPERTEIKQNIMTDEPASGKNTPLWEHPAQNPSQGARASNQASWPFPFFGAGTATYYEWAEVILRFVHPPREEQVAFIGQSAPPPLKSSPVRCNGKMLLAGGGQFINTDIERA
jgi:hypothetical protein